MGGSQEADGAVDPEDIARCGFHRTVAIASDHLSVIHGPELVHLTLEPLAPDRAVDR